MPKKIIIISIIFLGVFIIYYPNKQTLSVMDSEEPSNTNQIVASVQDGKAVSRQENTQREILEENILSKILDQKISPSVRLELILDYDLKKNENVKLLTDFILSPNPYDIDGAPPHHILVYKHDAEASLRVYALRRLSEELSIKQFEEIVLTIENDGNDNAIIRIANEALEFKKRGENYFESMVKGIQAMPIPNTD